MIYFKLLSSISQAIIIFLLFCFPLNVFSAEDECITCHADVKNQNKSFHKALVTGCFSCHQKVEGKNHPQEKDSIKLTNKVPQLCFACHKESNFQGRTVHSLGGMCKACHKPHNSENTKLLISEPPELCYNCHDKSKFNKKNIHKALPTVGCTTCHSPHASQHQFLLPKPINDTCIVCHKPQASGRHVTAVVGGYGKKYHPVRGAIDPRFPPAYIKVPDPNKPGQMKEVIDPKNPGKEMTCVSCHDAHASDYQKLFYSERMCENCHTF